MAIDTRTRRGSVLQYDMVWTEMLPHPNGTIDEDDRSNLLSLYGAIDEVVNFPTAAVCATGTHTTTAAEKLRGTHTVTATKTGTHATTATATGAAQTC